MIINKLGLLGYDLLLKYNFNNYNYRSIHRKCSLFISVCTEGKNIQSALLIGQVDNSWIKIIFWSVYM